MRTNDRRKYAVFLLHSPTAPKQDCVIVDNMLNDLCCDCGVGYRAPGVFCHETFVLFPGSICKVTPFPQRLPRCHKLLNQRGIRARITSQALGAKLGTVHSNTIMSRFRNCAWVHRPLRSVPIQSVDHQFTPKRRSQRPIITALF